MKPEDFDEKRWAVECEEWQAIALELINARPGDPPTAFEVSVEQEKRMRARGERPMFPRRRLEVVK